MPVTLKPCRLLRRNRRYTPQRRCFKAVRVRLVRGRVAGVRTWYWLRPSLSSHSHRPLPWFGTNFWHTRQRARIRGPDERHNGHAGKVRGKVPHMNWACANAFQPLTSPETCVRARLLQRKQQYAVSKKRSVEWLPADKRSCRAGTTLTFYGLAKPQPTRSRCQKPSCCPYFCTRRIEFR
jgi:hypothetical protein